MYKAWLTSKPLLAIIEEIDTIGLNRFGESGEPASVSFLSGFEEQHDQTDTLRVFSGPYSAEIF